jgi:hypothetical protein
MADLVRRRVAVIATPGTASAAIAANRDLHWPHSQGREARQLARAAVDESRADYQYEDAKALGITFPITLLGRADEVIE